MRRFRSLRVQTAAIILAGLLLSNLAGYWLYLRDRQNTLLLTEALDIAERAAGVSRLLRDLPPTWRPDVVQASDSRTFRVWTSSEAVLAQGPRTEDETDIETYIRNQVPRIAGNDMRVRFSQSPLATPSPPLRDPLPIPDLGEIGAWNLAISIDHGEGQWLNFLGHINTPRSYLPTFLALNLLSAAFGIGLLAFGLVNRVTAPLNRLAEAAHRLGRNIYAPPVPETGPQEVRVAARAFNTMQRRLIRHVESRTEMLAAISHDLRTPITQMRLRAELAPDEEERTKTIAALDDMNAIIGTFLDYARATNEGEDRSVIDLGALAQSICDDFADAGDETECTARGRVLVNCKRLALKRALSNLIGNAIAYGVRARVLVRVVNDEALVVIDDDGPGIRDDQLEAAFIPFHRLDPSRPPGGGVGLGLSIAQAIIEDHGGTIRLANRAEGGLRVECRLPAQL